MSPLVDLTEYWQNVANLEQFHLDLKAKSALTSSPSIIEELIKVSFKIKLFNPKPRWKSVKHNYVFHIHAFVRICILVHNLIANTSN